MRARYTNHYFPLVVAAKAAIHGLSGYDESADCRRCGARNRSIADGRLHGLDGVLGVTVHEPSGD